ncbi:hypothetical protein Mapa_009311 [Marchantia paleacea]|nr:hypothetical protein Mapa_009311 [Marchantia paleacea]
MLSRLQRVATVGFTPHLKLRLLKWKMVPQVGGVATHREEEPSISHLNVGEEQFHSS